MKNTTPFACWLAALILLATGCSGDNNGSNSVVVPPLLDRYSLSSPDSIPEGVAFDTQARAFYVTSLQGASITRINADGSESIFRAADNSASLVGVKVDSERRRLWVCAREVNQTDNRVWVYNLDNGEKTNEYLLGALATNGSCNDLALDSAGNAYVTDSTNPNIYRLDATTGQGSLLVSDPLFADITTLGLGLNGIAVQAGNTALLVGKFAPPSLFRVDLGAGNNITPVALSGDTLSPPDGLAFLGDVLYTVSDNTVSRITPNAGFTQGNVTTVEQISGLSTATVANGSLYVIKSEVTRFVLNQPPQLPFEIFKVDLTAFD